VSAIAASIHIDYPRQGGNESVAAEAARPPYREAWGNLRLQHCHRLRHELAL